MNKPISITIKETRERIISALNDSNLPPCILEGIIVPIAQQITQAAAAEVEQAEKNMTEHAEEVQGNG